MINRDFLHNTKENKYIQFRVCGNPIYIEAREQKTKKDWTGSKSTLIHQVNSTTWAYGFSNKFGFVDN